jgi:2-polyprenyl-3-methyl-5-hydroxy-6-metoxy-1,4-benzoquinol methylase
MIRNNDPASDRRDCRVCGSETTERFYAIEKPATRAGVVFVCGQCNAWSFYPAQTAVAYGEEYYGSGNSKVGGLAQQLRIFSANGRARFAARLVGKGECLDIGCGGGEFLEALQRWGWSVRGTELPGPAFERAERKLPERIVCTDRFEIAVRPGSCDLVTMWQVFEHLESPRQTLAACRELLADGGVLAIGVPNPESWQARWGREDWLHLDPPRHLHLESIRTLIRLAEELGFQWVATRNPWLEFGPIGWLQTAMNKLGFSRDYFFERMKDRWTGVPVTSRIAWNILAACLAMPAFVLALLEWMRRRTATYEVYLRYRFPNTK